MGILRFAPAGFAVKGNSHLDKSPQVLPCYHVKSGRILQTFWPPKTCKTPGDLDSGGNTYPQPLLRTLRGQRNVIGINHEEHEEHEGCTGKCPYHYRWLKCYRIVKERPHRRCCNMDDCIVSTGRFQDRELAALRETPQRTRRFLEKKLD